MEILGLDSRQKTESSGLSWPRLSAGDRIKWILLAGDRIKWTGLAKIPGRRQNQVDIHGLDSRQEAELSEKFWPRLSAGDRINWTFMA